MTVLMRVYHPMLAFGQSVVNIFWYAADVDPVGIDPQYEQDSFATVFSNQVADDLAPAIMEQVVRQEPLCQVLGVDGTPLTIQPTAAFGPQPGSAVGNMMGTFNSMILSAIMKRLEFATPVPPTPPKRGHLRVGPISEAWANDDGTLTAAGQAAGSIWAGGMTVTVQNGPASPLQWIPVRLGRSATGGIRGLAQIIGAEPVLQMSTCRSRRPRGYGA